MSPIFVSIGPLKIYWYSFLILVAIIIGYNIAQNYSKKLNFSSSIIPDLILGLVISAIIGARAYYVIFNFSNYKDNIIDIFKIWKGGLAIYGAIIAGTLYILYFSIKKKVSFIRLLDIISLSLLLGQAIGRWGNFFNQEAYGGITSLDNLKSLHLPQFIIEGMYIEGAYRTPTFLYESIWCLIGVIILLNIRKRKSNLIGKQISFYLVWYGIGRFIIEGLRSDSLYLGSLRISQIVSIILIVIGLIGNLIIYKRTHQKIKNISVNTDTGIGRI